MFSRILSFFYPTLCLVCDTKDSLAEKVGICRSCVRERNQAQKLAKRILRCGVCGQTEKAGSEEVCDYCSSRFLFFSQVVSLRFRLGWERKIFQKCKFENDKVLANFFALDFQAKIKTLAIRPDRILLVPSKDREGGRDYHPAEVLAMRLAKKWNITKVSLIRKKSKEKQSGKSYHERFSHAKKAFEIIKKDRSWEGLDILIIDDIFTTGATLNEVARLLLLNGAKTVSCMVLLSNEGD